MRHVPALFPASWRRAVLATLTLFLLGGTPGCQDEVEVGRNRGIPNHPSSGQGGDDTSVGAAGVVNGATGGRGSSDGTGGGAAEGATAAAAGDDGSGASRGAGASDGAGGAGTPAGAGGASTGMTGGASAATANGATGGRGAAAGDGGGGSSAQGGLAGSGGAGAEGGSGGRPLDPECEPGFVFEGDYHTGVDAPSALDGATSVTGSVEAGAADLPAMRCVQEMGGDLTVLDPIGTLTELTGLAGLARVSGNLSVVAPALTKLGLDALTRIDGDFRVESGVMVTLDGPPNLASVGGDLHLFTPLTGAGSGTVAAVEGFDTLRTVGGSLLIAQPASLASLRLPSLEHIGGDFDTNAGAGELGVLETPRLEEVDGYLSLSGQLLTTLEGMSALTRVGGRFSLYLCPELENLKGLENLRSVGGLNLTDVYALSDISGLDNLESIGSPSSIGGDLWLYRMPLLTGLDALSKLTTIRGKLYIDRVPLTDLEGLRNVRKIGNGLEIRETNLSDLRGLRNVTDVCAVAPNGDQMCGITLWTNPLLATLAGFPPTSRLGWLTVFDHPVLSDISALGHLNEVLGTLFIAFCNEVTSVSDLWPLEFVGGAVNIIYNPKLKNCNIQELGEHIEFIGEDLFFNENSDEPCD